MKLNSNALKIGKAPNMTALFPVKNSALISPNTLYSPKDKVSNMTWNNTIQCNEDRPVVTVYKHCST